MTQTAAKSIPMVAMRGVSAFPNMLLNFDAMRPVSVGALEAAMQQDRLVFLLAQRDESSEMPDESELYVIGTVCEIKQLMHLPEGGVRALVEGLTRARLVHLVKSEPYFLAEVAIIPAVKNPSPEKARKLLEQTHALLERYLELAQVSADGLMAIVSAERDPGFIADYVAQNLQMRHEKKQSVLNEPRPLKRLELLNSLLLEEIGILEVEIQMRQKTGERMFQNQREHILREQMKTIQMELGMDDEYGEIEEYHDRVVALQLPQEHEEKLLKEVVKLSKQPYSSSEAAVIRSYLDTCLELPWHVSTELRANVEETQRILDEDHYGLEKVKQRIVEYVAVRQFAPEAKGGILCLVGPPGTGKTSIAMSVARALNRKLARISLGGIHDEAEIRGHRKTYVGAMPGRIMAAVAQAGSNNPLLLLDEIDKLGSDYRGDPSAALLEALDPEQNATFRDHYIELPFDLSDVLFITTANTTSTIPRPLLDRMELIELSSYTDEEKVHIARNHLLPKQMKKHGLKSRSLRLGDDVLREIIAGYTRESGVRVMERQLAALCRKCALRFVREGKKSMTIRPAMLEDLLGPRKYHEEPQRYTPEVGLVHGLAWTSVGGELLDVEVNVMPGSGKLELTGNLGTVMRESVLAGLSYIRSKTEQLGIDPDFHKNLDIHVHFPEGAVPKDGPSAGITVTLAMISALTGAPVRGDIAMTGEITLRGRVLAIGGLREKTMGALRAGIHTLIIPQSNESDLEDIDQEVRHALNFVTTDHIDKILDFALLLSERRPVQSGRGEERPPMDSVVLGGEQELPARQRHTI